jgi:hypothetical protein
VCAMGTTGQVKGFLPMDAWSVARLMATKSLHTSNRSIWKAETCRTNEKTRKQNEDTNCQPDQVDEASEAGCNRENKMKTPTANQIRWMKRAKRDATDSKVETGKEEMK